MSRVNPLDGALHLALTFAILGLLFLVVATGVRRDSARNEFVDIAASVAAHNRLQSARNIRALRDAQERAMDLKDDLGRVERAINELNQKGKP